MIFRPARLVLLSVLLLLFGPHLTASKTEQAAVDEKIDRITEPPEYDWLRGEGAAGEGGSKGGAGTRGGKGKKAGAPGGEGGCDFAPSTTVTPPRERSGRSDPSCRRGASDCGTSPIGSCDCNAPVGSCAAPGIGALSPLGYLLFGLFLAFLLGVLVWAIVKRQATPMEESELDADTIKSPGDLRPSQVPRFSVDAMMARARKAAAQEDFKNAVGFAYLAGIDRLHRAGFVDLRRSTTNLEIVDAVAKANGLHRPTAELIRVFEDLFFGEKRPLETHWEACRHIVEEELVGIAFQD